MYIGKHMYICIHIIIFIDTNMFIYKHIYKLYVYRCTYVCQYMYVYIIYRHITI